MAAASSSGSCRNAAPAAFLTCAAPPGLLRYSLRAPSGLCMGPRDLTGAYKTHSGIYTMTSVEVEWKVLCYMLNGSLVICAYWGSLAT